MIQEAREALLIILYIFFFTSVAFWTIGINLKTTIRFDAAEAIVQNASR